MRKQGAAGPVVAIVIGALLGLFALYGLLRAALTVGSVDAASGAGAVFGVILWGGLSALFITLGVRALNRIKRSDGAQ